MRSLRSINDYNKLSRTHEVRALHLEIYITFYFGFDSFPRPAWLKDYFICLRFIDCSEFDSMALSGTLLPSISTFASDADVKRKAMTGPGTASLVSIKQVITGHRSGTAAVSDHVIGSWLLLQQRARSGREPLQTLCDSGAQNQP